jgi:hypothetical protein
METLRAAEILEPVVAEVAESQPVGALGEQVTRGLGEENLPAVCRRRHAGGPVHVQADVPVGSKGGLTGVEPHADADDFAVRPRLRG